MKSLLAVKISIVILLLASFTFTVGNVYSYWMGEYQSTSYQVTLPPNQVHKVEVDLQDVNYNLRLVPTGFVEGQYDVDEIIFTYVVDIPVKVDSVMDLYISVEEILIDGDSTYAHLVEISINGHLNESTIDIFNDSIMVYISIKLNEPVDEKEGLVRGIPANVADGKQAYEAIKGREITFGLAFQLLKKLN